jgi:hypothetical protein
MQGKGDQNIELVGLKLPSAEITQWGLVLLLCAQFYFWLHLHELKKKIEATSPGWDVAWVGMYTSVAAELTMWISACLLPVVAVSLLAIKIPKILTTILPKLYKWELWIICCAVIAVSAALAVATAERLEKIKADRGDSTTDVSVPEISSPS